MVNKPVKDSGCDGVVADDRALAGKLHVRGDHRAVMFVGVIDDLEQQVRTLGVNRQIAQAVDGDDALFYAAPPIPGSGGLPAWLYANR